MHLTLNRQEKCVMARIMRQKKRHQKNFTLKQYGTWRAAIRAARKWMNEIAPGLPPLMRSKGRMTKRNRSGYVGVHLARRLIRKPNGNEYEYWRWLATWPGCPFTGGVGWSVTWYGDDDAYILAVLTHKAETV